MCPRVGNGSLHGLASEIGIVLENVVDRIAVLNAAQHGINGHSRAPNDWRAALNLSIHGDELIALFGPAIHYITLVTNRDFSK